MELSLLTFCVILGIHLMFIMYVCMYVIYIALMYFMSYIF